MYKLKQVPVFYEFLKRFFKAADIDFKKDINDIFLISGVCKCGQKNCASVYLYTEDKEADIFNSFHIYTTNKGLILINFYQENYIDFEALEYDFYPYHEQLLQFLDSEDKSKLDFQLLESDIKKLDEYFENLKFDQPNLIQVDWVRTIIKLHYSVVNSNN